MPSAAAAGPARGSGGAGVRLFPQALASAELRHAYRDAEHNDRIRLSKVGCVLALVLIPAGVTLDYLVYPQHFAQFLGLRLGFDVLVALILVLHFLPQGQRRIRWLMLGWLTAPQLMIAYMVYLTDGYASSYYAGLNLAVLGMGVLLPFSLGEVTIFCLVTLAAYMSAGQSHPGTVAEPAVVYNNLYFLLLTAIISATAVYFNARRRFSEFRLAYELEAQNRKLEELDRLKSQFFANVSHELRTPLTLILAPVNDLLEGPHRLADRIAEPLGIVRSNALRLLKLVNDLLDVIRLEEGKGQLERKPVIIDSLVSGTVDAMSSLAEAREVNLHKDMQAPGLMLYGDEHALEKVFFNLLSNALKFTPAGGSISVRSRRAVDGVAISVQDTGIGIGEQDLPHIFDRFRQADSSNTRRYQGTGLGLALVKELTEHHGGRVSACSRPGVGTTVTVELPLAAPSATDPGTATADEPPPGERLHLLAERSAGLPLRAPDTGEPVCEPASGRATVLVVDDEPDMRRYLVETLRREFGVLQAGDGRVALELAQRLKPDLMLLDLMLPELDGLEVCRRLKHDPHTRGIKLILLTARVDEAAKLTALAHGADDFLTKPFSSVEIRTRLKNLLQTAILERDLQARNDSLQTTLTQLQQTQAQLVQSEKLNALGSLSAGLLHEVNNPLNYSLTALTLARKQVAARADEDLREMLGDIEQGMQRIRRIVSDLRAFAYPSEGDHQPFPLQEAIANAIQFTSHENQGIPVESRIDPEVQVSGSRSHIVQVLINLLSNAGKAIAAAGRAGEIGIDGEFAGDRYRLRIRDNGIGMDAATLSRVFDPFFTTRDVGQGMGLGLSICHTIVGNHGGRLGATSEPGLMTEFSFDLPLAAAALPAREAKA